MARRYRHPPLSSFAFALSTPQVCAPMYVPRVRNRAVRRRHFSRSPNKVPCTKAHSHGATCLVLQNAREGSLTFGHLPGARAPLVHLSSHARETTSSILFSLPTHAPSPSSIFMHGAPLEQAGVVDEPSILQSCPAFAHSYNIAAQENLSMPWVVPTVTGILLPVVTRCTRLSR